MGPSTITKITSLHAQYSTRATFKYERSQGPENTLFANNH